MFLGIVYVRDTTRGGLCSYPVFNNGINGAFCRTEAGQTAAIIFLFVTLVVYLIGAAVCLKLWRHEAARRYRERRGHEVTHCPDCPFSRHVSGVLMSPTACVPQMLPTEPHAARTLVSRLLSSRVCSPHGRVWITAFVFGSRRRVWITALCLSAGGPAPQGSGAGGRLLGGSHRSRCEGRSRPRAPGSDSVGTHSPTGHRARLHRVRGRGFSQ